jgi:fluoride ion exporter CrcB/FEX
MAGPMIAIVGDVKSQRTYDPPMKDPAKARKAAQELGRELAQRGARLQVYGGEFIETEFVTGFVAGKPAEDRSVLMWYTKDQEPPPFAEEATNPKLFERRSERGADWEVAFYRALTRADGVILLGGAKATMISGQIAIGGRIPILALSEFGGGAAKVWETLSAGEDLPNRDEINLMARPWGDDSAAACVKALFAQHQRRRLTDSTPRPLASIVAGLLFTAALAIVPWVWGGNAFAVWMLFLAPLLAGGAGASIRPIIDRMRGTQPATPSLMATFVVGLVAGGIAGVLFVTAQLTADPTLTGDRLIPYAQRSIPFAVGIGFIAGLTSDAVFSKLLGLDVVNARGVSGGGSESGRK